MNNIKLKFRAIPIFILIVLFSVLCCTQRETSQISTGQPNVVIIFVDDMGYGDLECYGHPNIKTPHIDKMADEGIRLTSFYAAASVCTPSRAALLTGRYPIRNAPNNFGPESKNGLPLTEVTIADLMSEKGYETMAIGKWHLGHQPEYLPTSRGFDSFYGLPYSNDMILPWCPWLTAKDTLFMYRNEKRVKEIGFNQDDLTINYTNKAVEFIKTKKDKPFFLYLAHSMPHLPISTSVEFRGKSEGGLYGDVIETLDWSVGQILKTLKEHGLDENTFVVFTSDNGPWHNLPERMLQNGVKSWHTGSTGLLNGAKGSTYEGGFRVPGIVRWPGQIPQKQVSSEMATTMDLFTTIIEITGAKLPIDRDIDGKNILSFLKGIEKSPVNELFYLRGTQVEAVRVDEWKYRITKNEGIQLFDLKNDPSEMYNRAEENKELVKTLHNKLVNFAKETGSIIPIPEN